MKNGDSPLSKRARACVCVCALKPDTDHHSVISNTTAKKKKPKEAEIRDDEERDKYFSYVTFSAVTTVQHALAAHHEDPGNRYSGPSRNPPPQTIATEQQL